MKLTLRLLESKQRQYSRRNITQSAFFPILPVLIVRKRVLGVLRSCDDERNLVGRMGRVGGSRVQVDHLFRVSVVGCYEECVARLLACVVDRANRRVGVGDGFDGCVKDARVSDLL